MHLPTILATTLATLAAASRLEVEYYTEDNCGGAPTRLYTTVANDWCFKYSGKSFNQGFHDKEYCDRGMEVIVYKSDDCSGSDSQRWADSDAGWDDLSQCHTADMAASGGWNSIELVCDNFW